MGIMDNEGHDPMGFGNVRSARSMQADPDPHAALKDARAELDLLRARARRAHNALREMFWEGGIDQEDACKVQGILLGDDERK